MRSSLLDIARPLYAEKGVKPFISEIASAAGVTRPTIYKHLGGNAAILARFSTAQHGAPRALDIDTRIMRGVMPVVTIRGFKAATIDAIVQASGVGSATIISPVHQQRRPDQGIYCPPDARDHLPDFPTGTSERFGDQLVLIGSHMLRFMFENQLLVRLIFSGAQEDRACFGALRDQSNSTFARLDVFFQRHQTKGSIRADITPRDLTANLFGTIHAQAVILPTDGSIDFAQAEQSICRFFNPSGTAHEKRNLHAANCKKQRATSHWWAERAQVRARWHAPHFPFYPGFS